MIYKISYFMYHVSYIIFSRFWGDSTMEVWPYKGGSGACVLTADFVEVIGGLVQYSDDDLNQLSEEDRSDIESKMMMMGKIRAVRAGEIIETVQDGTYNGQQFVKDCKKVS